MVGTNPPLFFLGDLPTTFGWIGQSGTRLAVHEISRGEERRVYMIAHDSDNSTMLVGASWPPLVRTTYYTMTIYHYVFCLAPRQSPSFTE